MKKKFTLTFLSHINNGKEIFKSINCDYWFEGIGETISMVYCINKNKPVIGYTSDRLIKIVQNFDFMINNDHKEQDRMFA